jgi:hypothetical protein
MELATTADTVNMSQPDDVFYSIEGLMRLRGTEDADAITKQVQGHEILTVLTSDQLTLFPGVQFTKTGEPKPGMSELLRTLLNDDEDGWVVLYWLLASFSEFNGRNALEVLNLGDSDEISELLALAHEDSNGWRV